MIFTNELDLPQQFVNAASTTHVTEDGRYSVTQVMKGIREAILTRRHEDEIVVDVADQVWAIWGSAMHTVFEKAKEGDAQLKEEKIVMEMPNGYRLSGIFDLYDAEAEKVTDWKSASVWKAVMNDWDDYRRQVMAYCVILRSMGFPARRGEVVALLKDHSKTKAETDRSYPQHPVVKVGWEFSDDEIDGMREWLERRFEDIEAAESMPDDELPPCTSEERWQRGEKWAVVKDGRKKAVKLWDSESDAMRMAEDMGDGYHVEHRPGEDVKCQKYCAVRGFCSQWLENNS